MNCMIVLIVSSNDKHLIVSHPQLRYFSLFLNCSNLNIIEFNTAVLSIKHFEGVLLQFSNVSRPNG